MPELSDAQVAALLDRLTPPSDERSRWQQIVAEAESEGANASGSGHRHRFRFSRPRALLVAAIVVVVVVLAPLSALAVTQGWWFFRFGQAPTPVSPVVIVARGVWQGTTWTVTAYRSSTDGISTAFNPQPAHRGAITAGIGCAPISGVALTPQTKHTPPLRITYMSGEGSGSFPGFVVGPVVGNAQTVEIKLSNHRLLRTGTIAAPSELGANVRFYIAQLPAGLSGPPALFSPISSVTGFDANGRVVAHLVVPGRRLNNALYQVSNRGTLVKLSPKQKHAFHLAHRSTLIYLLGTRDGQSF